MSMHFFSSQALPATPWKNGGGTTQEVVCWPQGAGLDSFEWRISIAHIAQSGPFSAFAGIDRVITLLSGDGVHLHSPDGAINHRLGRALQPFAFSGDVALDCDLLGGPSYDFNVMTRRGVVRAVVSIHYGGGVRLASPHGLLLARAGQWQLQGGTALQAGAHDGVYWAAHTGDAVEASAASDDAVLIAVALNKVAKGA